jgi:hypothetical protein
VFNFLNKKLTKIHTIIDKNINTTLNIIVYFNQKYNIITAKNGILTDLAYIKVAICP